MNDTHKTLILILVASVVASIAPYASKKFTMSGNYFFILLAALAFAILIYCYVEIFRNNAVSTYYPTIKITSICLVVFFGMTHFDEILSSKQIIGVVMALCAIYLLD
jgi:uncharacterized membrane protein